MASLPKAHDRRRNHREVQRIFTVRCSVLNRAAGGDPRRLPFDSADYSPSGKIVKVFRHGRLHVLPRRIHVEHRGRSGEHTTVTPFTPVLKLTARINGWSNPVETDSFALSRSWIVGKQERRARKCLAVGARAFRGQGHVHLQRIGTLRLS